MKEEDRERTIKERMVVRDRSSPCEASSSVENMVHTG